MKGQTFRNVWKLIRLSNRESKSNDINNIQKPFIEEYENSLLNLQSNQESNDKCSVTEVNWNLPIFQKRYILNEMSLESCFKGILQCMHCISNKKLNIKEIEFHYSNAQSIMSNIDNILALFDYQNTETYIKIPVAKNSFFGVTFKRIKINPYAYALRMDSSSNTSKLISFTFEGYDEENKKWDVLDERVNESIFSEPGAFSLFYTMTTSKNYSKFVIKQTEPGHNGFWGFSLAAFDIHGVPSIQDETEECPNLIENITDLNVDFDFAI